MARTRYHRTLYILLLTHITSSVLARALNMRECCLEWELYNLYRHPHRDMCRMELHSTKTVFHLDMYHANRRRTMDKEAMVHPIGTRLHIPIQYTPYMAYHSRYGAPPRLV